MRTFDKKRIISAYSYFHRPWLGHFLVSCVVLCLSSISLLAQTINTASIEASSSNRLVVTFSEAITVRNASGFRLVGGVARIDRLLSGSGSRTLTFALTDYVLPDDTFRVLHWPEMSDARSSSGKLPAIDRAVNTDNINRYGGNGNLYYVANNGSDANNQVGSKSNPFKTIGKAQSTAGPGDFILLRRGDTFSTQVIVQKSGQPGQHLTFAAYGKGNRPVVDYSNDATFIIRGGDFITIDNINIKVRQSGESGAGVRIENNSHQVVASNCLIEGYNSASFGVHLQKSGGPDGTGATTIEAPLVINNYITGFRTNIRASGYKYNDQYNVIGGLIENNVCRNSTDDDGVNLQRGYFNNLVFRKNDIAGYDDDGIDTYGAHDVIIEYNTVHDPRTISTRGKGIKAGGPIRSNESSTFAGTLSSGIIVRYNTVRDIRATGSCSCDGIVTNGGGSGQIYGNVVYNVAGHGMKVDGNPDDWDIYHNTVVDVDKTGLQFYTDTDASGRVSIRNNIFYGKEKDLEFARIGNILISGGKNIVVDDTPPTTSQYSGTGDFRAGVGVLFKDFNQNDYRLTSASPAVNAGTSAIPPYARDIRGFLIQDAPDIGAFEFGDQFGPLDPNPNPTPGVAYAYYEGNWTQLPTFSNLTPVKTGTLPTFSLSPAQREDYYGLVYTTYLQVNTAGSYTFYTNTDDGSKLYVNDQGVVNNDGLRPPVEKSGSLTLPVGKHKLVVHYFEGYGGQLLEVKYAGPGISKQTIPDNLLFLQGDDTPPTQPTVRAQAGNDRSVSVNASPVTLSGFGQGPNPFRGYLWQKLSGPSVTLTKANTANVVLTNLSVGTYVFRFTATDSEGNSGSDELTLTVTGSSARTAENTENPALSEEGLATDKLIAYPNPTHDRLTVHLEGNATQTGVLSLTDVSGRRVYQETIISPQRQETRILPTDALPEGIYLLRWQQDRTLRVFKTFIRH